MACLSRRRLTPDSVLPDCLPDFAGRERREPGPVTANTVEVQAAGLDPDLLKRSFYTSSSGGCGKGALEAVRVEAPPIESELRVAAGVVAELPGRLRGAQAAFAETGGLRATGLFDASGELLCVREDVGRHNAMDKVVGSQSSWARHQRITLCSFAREGRVNVYTEPNRID